MRTTRDVLRTLVLSTSHASGPFTMTRLMSMRSVNVFIWVWPSLGIRGCRFFFFSSRRRHTRFDCDWSSDVCSSDLVARALVPRGSRNAWAELHLLLEIPEGTLSGELTRAARAAACGAGEAEREARDRKSVGRERV